MIRRILAIAEAGLLSACAATSAQQVAPAPAPAPAPSLQFVDLTDDFARVWERDASLPTEQRVARLKEEFAPILPGFYGHERMGLPSSERYDAFLARAIERFPEQRAGIEDVSRRFGGMMESALTSFEREFGAMTGYPPVYLVHSLGEFDGGTRNLPGGVKLLFGADMIDQIYRDVPVQPFFHHELFHLMHHRTFNECGPLWCTLWSEGLAVYVASRLNPGSSDEALLLTEPEPLRAAVDRNRAHAICTTLSKLQSTDRADRSWFFSNGETDGRLPSRFGYYVGMLVAEELGRTRSLRELAALRAPEAGPLIEATLRGMAECPAG
jgi:hypothetical protein